MSSTIYFNGKIITMTQRNHYAEAVLVNNGIITKVGSFKEINALCEDAEIFDLQGSTLMPSFIDSHSHITAAAISNCLIDVRPDSIKKYTSKEITEKLKKELKNINFSESRWLIATGFDPLRLEDNEDDLDKDLLNSVSNAVPVIVLHVSGHIAYVNNVGAKLLNYTGNNVIIPSGGVVTDGYKLEEQAFLSPDKQKCIKGPDSEDIVTSFIKTMEHYAANGITTTCDGKTDMASYKMLKSLSEKDKLIIDIVMYSDNDEIYKSLSYISPAKNVYSHNLKAGGFKIFLDGSPQGRTAWMQNNYKGTKNRGICTMSQERLSELIEKCSYNNRQINVHANGSAAIDFFISCIEKSIADTKKLRPVIIHCQTVTDEELKRMEYNNISASFFIDHVYFWGDDYKNSIFSNEIAERISPLNSAKDYGVKFTLHQDTPVVDCNMLFSLHTAVNRLTKTYRVLGCNQQIDIYSALEAVTKNAAYQIFEENAKGTIERGKRADFVILDQNPLEIARDKIYSIKVTKTIKDGKIIFDAINQAVALR